MRKDPTEFRKRFAAWKNGKQPYEAGLPKYEDGNKPMCVGEYNVYPSAIGASELNVTTPEIVITGNDKRPMYQRYAADSSTYDPELITNFTGLIPVIGEVQDATMAVDAYNKGDYLSAGMLGAGLVLPNIIKSPSKYIIKAGLKHAPEFTKNLYDISRLYITPKDNPRLRKYANEVSNLLLSDQMEKRGNKYRYIKQAKNISNTTTYFTHSDKHQFVRPIYNILGKEFVSPIPIPYNYRGLYNSTIPSISIKRSGHTPDEIRQITYHEASHASDLGRGAAGYTGFTPKTSSKYYDMTTEKRARVMSILTDAMHNGVNINDFDEMSKFLNINYKNPNYSSLLNNYNTTNGSSYLKEMMYGE